MQAERDLLERKVNELRRELHAKNKEIEHMEAELKLSKSQQVRAMATLSGLQPHVPRLQPYGPRLRPPCAQVRGGQASRATRWLCTTPCYTYVCVYQVRAMAKLSVQKSKAEKQLVSIKDQLLKLSDDKSSLFREVGSLESQLAQAHADREEARNWASTYRDMLLKVA